jgi:hypothetical protein
MLWFIEYVLYYCLMFLHILGMKFEKADDNIGNVYYTKETN